MTMAMSEWRADGRFVVLLAYRIASKDVMAV
jgi:hypothetical protein